MLCGRRPPTPCQANGQTWEDHRVDGPGEGQRSGLLRLAHSNRAAELGDLQRLAQGGVGRKENLWLEGQGARCRSLDAPQSVGTQAHRIALT